MIQKLYSAVTEKNGIKNERLRCLLLVLVAALMKVRYWLVRRHLVCQAGRRKLRVIFVIGDECKWKCQKVYEQMLRSERYDPFVLVTTMDLGWVSMDQQPERVRRCRRYLERKGLRVLCGCEQDDLTPIPIKVFRPDIVVYQQPWGMPDCQNPIAASSSALTFFMPYYIASVAATWLQHDAPLFRILYGNFLEGPEWVDFYRKRESKWRVACKTFVCSCPVREEIAAAGLNVEKENLVIYAPHWSIPVPGVSEPGGGSSFLQTGRIILEWAQCHREINWVFKPHPMLRVKLESSGVWGKDEIDEYWRSWGRIGEICETGDYFKLFYRSKAMITDCFSFLSEYLIVDRPLIRLEMNSASTHNTGPLNKKLEGMYRVSALDELPRVLEDVVARDVDFLAQKRGNVISEIGYDRNNASGQMMEILDSELECRTIHVSHWGKE